MDKEIRIDIGGNEMKIYHTETQADYDSLMVELEKQGVKWSLTTNPTEVNHWPEFESQTGIKVQDCILTYHGVEYFERANPETPIIKYTAKTETQLPEWANWLARDEDGDLYAFENKPIKSGVAWHIKDDDDDYRIMSETDDTFSHIKWIDEEPTKVKRVTGLGLATSDKYNRIMIAKAHGYDEVPEVADIINEPNHYKGKYGIETIDVIRNFGNDDMVAGFYWGNAIKYMTRYRNKNGLEDLKKARRNLDWLIEHMEEIE